jgi:hypothetical protein
MPGRSKGVTDPAEWDALTRVLREIEREGLSIAARVGVDLRVESSATGKFPVLAFRPRGFLPSERSA